MKVSRELIELAEEHQPGNLEVEILSFRGLKDYSTALSLSGGQDDDTLNEVLNRRNSSPLDEFSPEMYEESTSPELYLKTPGEEGHFMVTLSAPVSHTTVPTIMFGGNSGDPYDVRIKSTRKKTLRFYGQSLKPELFEEMVEKYHEPALDHSLKCA